MNQKGIPKIFISYSWSSQTHINWVVELSEKLMSDGVNVILDKWDLKEGHDSYHFMEQMVNDESISRVLIIIDKKYTEKANDRAGGVGTETLIITPKIYAKHNQEKFIPVIRELQDDGKPYLPTYAIGRIFIDFTSEENFLDEYDKLLRNIFNKPSYKKPPLGTPPSYILEEEPIQIKTYNKLKNLKNAIITNNKFTKSFIQDYLNTLILAFDDFRLLYEKQENFDDLFMENITNFIPYRDNFIEFSELLYTTLEPNEINEYLHNFFECLIFFKYPSPELSQYNELDFDNYRFIIYELFLYFISILIKYKLYNSVNFFLTDKYYAEVSRNYGNEDIFSYCIFSTHNIKTLELRRNRLKLRYFSMIAKTIEERANIKKYTFLTLLQSDLLIFLRTALSITNYDSYFDNPFVLWHPNLVKHGELVKSGLELFLRAKNKKYFQELKTILNIKDKAELISKWSIIKKEYKVDTFFDARRTSFEYLINMNELDTE